MIKGLYYGIVGLITTGTVLAAVGTPAANAQTGNSKSRTVAKSRSVRRQRPAPYVTLNLRNAPVRTALLQLFQKARRDYAIDQNIRGVVTLKVTRKPFAETLRLLAENASTPLAYTLDSGVYFIRPQGTRSTRSTVARSTANTETATNPENTANIDAANTITAPPLNNLGGTFIGGQPPASPLGVPGYPGLGFPTNSFGGAFPIYQYPTLYVAPNANFGAYFYQTPFVNGAQGNFSTPIVPNVPNGGYNPTNP